MSTFVCTGTQLDKLVVPCTTKLLAGAAGNIETELAAATVNTEIAVVGDDIILDTARCAPLASSSGATNACLKAIPPQHLPHPIAKGPHHDLNAKESLDC